MTGTATEYTLRQLLTALEKIDDLQAALKSVDTDELITRIVNASGTEINPAKEDGNLANIKSNTDNLTSDPATETTLNAIKAAVEKIDDLQQALSSIAGDELRVEVTGQPIEVIPDASEKIVGFEAVVEEALENEDLSVGTNNLAGTAVSSGEIWVVTQVAILYSGTVPTRIRIDAAGLATALNVLDQGSPNSDQWYPSNCWALLQAGDFMRGSVLGASAGDTLRFRYAGFKFGAP